MPDRASTQKPLGLRARKAAATRVAIARALARRLVDRPLSEIPASELAEAAGVSRMTFFNYFPTKEHVVDYVLGVWMYEQQHEARRLELRGVATILHACRTFGALTAESPARARRVSAYFAARPLDRGWPELTPADRALIAGDEGDAPLRQMRDLLVDSLAEARERGEIDPELDTYEIAHLLGLVVFGTCLLGHSRPDQDWEALYVHHARRALGIDGEG